MTREIRVGLISDTHGLLRPQALAAMRGSDRIVHAGDIGDAAIIDALERIAPVTAVRGNNDVAPWAASLRDDEVVIIGDTRIYVVHDVNTIAIDLQAQRIKVVVAGHSHRPLVRERDGITFVNPGSAGPRRFSLPISVGELVVSATGVRARLLTLDP
jgi:putative phosphoesterase